MATRNQVLSLFGATPAQIQEQQRQKQAEMILSQRDPYAKTGAALGTALAGLFGGKTPEVERAEQLQQALGQVQFENSESMYQGAEMLNTMGFTNEAVQLLGLAQDRAMNEQSMATSKAQEIKAGFMPVSKFQGMQDVYGKDMAGNAVVVGQKPVYDDVPIPIKDYDQYIKGEGDYAGWYPSAEQASATSKTTATPVPKNSVTIQTSTGTPVVAVPKEGGGFNYFTKTDEGTLGVQLTPEQVKEAGGQLANSQSSKLPVIRERRQQNNAATRTISPEETRKRMQQPSTAAEDQTNPFSM